MKKSLLLALALAASAPVHAAKDAVAYFAGGCFWCIESDFDKLPGVTSTVSGYTGGKEVNPTYEQVSGHRTGHTEALEVKYDADKVSYEQLLDYFWHHIDPLTANAQFCDKGAQYRSEIFVSNNSERQAALKSRDKVAKQLGKPIATQITAASTFYAAEDYHQDYYKKNPVRYKYYRFSCGRDQRLKEIWGKDAPAH